MEAESRKRGREQEETAERLDSERRVKKGDKDGYCRGGRREEGEDNEEKEMGVFEFPWQKGREGVMTEEEWEEAGVVLGDTFLGTLGRCCRETAEEVEIGGGGIRWMEDMTPSTSTSTSTSSSSSGSNNYNCNNNNSSSSTTLTLGEGVNLEELWDDRDGIWASLLH